MGLKFKSGDLQRELNFFSGLASEYLERDSKERLKQIANRLSTINCKTNSTEWQISRECPLKTIPSNGAYEKSGKGMNVEGTLSFIWNLRCVDSQTVELCGNSSALISIYKTQSPKCVFEWHVDIATDPAAPGAVFHTQVKNPLGLPVPRFPSLLFTPADCLDFLLGELFQECWPRHQNNHQETQRFAREQEKRLSRLLNQQARALAGGGSLSAWTSLKEWRPDDALFI